MAAFGTTQTKATGVRGSVMIMTWPIAPSPAQSFKQFDFVITDANAAAIGGAALGSRIAGTSGTTSRVLGRATTDALDENGTQRTQVNIIVAQPGTEFEMPLDHATPASAVAVPTTGQLLTSFEVKNVNTNGGYYAVSLDNTTNIKCQIKDYNTEDLPTWPSATTTGTTQYPRVWVEFLPAHSWTAIQS